MALKVVSFNISPELDKKISAYEMDHKLSRADSMRKILTDFFEGKDEDSQIVARMKKIDSKI